MTTGARTLIREENVVSLRTAFVLDDGYVVSFVLTPRWLDNSIPGSCDYANADCTTLYRRKRSVFSQFFCLSLGVTEKKILRSVLSPHVKRGLLRRWVGYFLLRSQLTSMEKDIRSMEFEKPPELKLLWTDSGHSVALFLDGEPWAFIHEGKNEGYSKGILRPTVGNPWDEDLFLRTFLNK